MHALPQACSNGTGTLHLEVGARIEMKMNWGKTKVRVIFPSESSTPNEILRQEIEGVRTHFTDAGARPVFAAPEATLPTYRSRFPELNIVSAPRKFTADEHVVLLESYHDRDGFSAHWESGDRAHQAGAMVWSIKFSGGVVADRREWSIGELQSMEGKNVSLLLPGEPCGVY